MKKQFSVTKNAKWFVTASVVLIVAGLVMFFIEGFALGLDFSGGSITTYDMGQSFTDADMPAIQKIGDEIIPGETQYAVSGGSQAIFRYQAYANEPDKEMAMRESLLTEIQKTYPNAKMVSHELIGATAGDEMKANALYSVLIACALMLIYIAIRFEFVYGVAAIIGLIHDVLFMAIIMVVTRTQLNSPFIAAMLTIVGYSINDTIVLFDRVRENVKKMKGKPRREIVDISFLETLTRTLNTSLTVFFTLVALYVLGVQSIREFALPLIAGVVSGTYSSILISAPIWIWIHEGIDKRKKAKIAAKKQLKGGKQQPKPSKSKA